jgi:hypothetical protein
MDEGRGGMTVAKRDDAAGRGFEAAAVVVDDDGGAGRAFETQTPAALRGQHAAIDDIALHQHAAIGTLTLHATVVLEQEVDGAGGIGLVAEDLAAAQHQPCAGPAAVDQHLVALCEAHAALAVQAQFARHREPRVA